MTAKRAVILVKKVNYFGEFGYLNSSCIIKSIILFCFWSPRETNLHFCSKTQWQMFLLVSGRHVGTHLDGHQHGVSLNKNCYNLNLGQSLCKFTIFRFSYSGLYLLNSFDFYFDMAWHLKPAIRDLQGSKLRLIGRQCDQKLSTGN